MPKQFVSEADRQGVAAVDRALSIVLVLQVAAQPLTLADLARATGLYKSTLLRLLASLERYALVVRRPDQHYSLGQFAFRLGQSFEATFDLKQYIFPALQKLIAQGTESASFHIWHDEKTRQCLFRIDSNHATLDRIKPGDLLPLNRGAAGKVLREFRAGVQVHDDTDLVCVSFGERGPACAAIACPVFGSGGVLLGALTLSGPQERFSDTAVKRMGKHLLTTAQQTTEALNGHWPTSSPRETLRISLRDKNKQAAAIT